MPRRSTTYTLAMAMAMAMTTNMLVDSAASCSTSNSSRMAAVHICLKATTTCSDAQNNIKCYYDHCGVAYSDANNIVGRYDGIMNNETVRCNEGVLKKPTIVKSNSDSDYSCFLNQGSTCESVYTAAVAQVSASPRVADIPCALFDKVWQCLVDSCGSLYYEMVGGVTCTHFANQYSPHCGFCDIALYVPSPENEKLTGIDQQATNLANKASSLASSGTVTVKATQTLQREFAALLDATDATDVEGSGAVLLALSTAMTELGAALAANSPAGQAVTVNSDSVQLTASRLATIAGSTVHIGETGAGVVMPNDPQLNAAGIVVATTTNKVKVIGSTGDVTSVNLVQTHGNKRMLMDVGGLTTPITITFANLKELDLSRATCRWYDAATGSWSGKGCEGPDATGACKCTHLTDFMIFQDKLANVDPGAEEDGGDIVYAIGLVVYSLCGVAVVALLIKFKHHFSQRNDSLIKLSAVILASCVCRAWSCGSLYTSSSEPAVVMSMVIGFVPYVLNFMAFFYIINIWKVALEEHEGSNNNGDGFKKLNSLVLKGAGAVGFAVGVIMFALLAAGPKAVEPIAIAGNVFMMVLQSGLAAMAWTYSTKLTSALTSMQSGHAQLLSQKTHRLGMAFVVLLLLQTLCNLISVFASAARGVIGGFYMGIELVSYMVFFALFHLHKPTNIKPKLQRGGSRISNSGSTNSTNSRSRSSSRSRHKTQDTNIRHKKGSKKFTSVGVVVPHVVVPRQTLVPSPSESESSVISSTGAPLLTDRTLEDSDMQE